MATRPSLTEAFYACEDLGYEVARYPIPEYMADELVSAGYEDRCVAFSPTAYRRYVVNRRLLSIPIAYITFRADEVPRFD